MRRKQRYDDGTLTFIAMLMLMIFIMPFYGLYRLSKGTPSDLALGGVLTVLGTAIWLFLRIGS